MKKVFLFGTVIFRRWRRSVPQLNRFVKVPGRLFVWSVGITD
jgi:hypothetical protein